ncbi:YeiH family protein [Hylemonella gracilis]|uniref:YeiH family protein n=1 Tax=Hylemonella gracilis TaxID=80880 RepID=UPI0009DCDB50|nr:YeiH family protein [Hylemonella gracilis]
MADLLPSPRTHTSARSLARSLSSIAPLLAGLRPNALPGLTLTLLISAVAMALAEQSWARQLGLSALTLAIALGLLLGHTVYPRLRRVAESGVDWSKQKLLRLGIVLFGLRLSFQDIAAVGWVGVAVDAAMLLSTFALALWLGRRWLRLDGQTVMLIGTGSAICGAAAVLATAPLLKATAEKIAVAVATVVVFGTLAMFLYPVLYALVQPWGVTAWAFGLYTGATVHEVAQVAAVGNTLGPEAANSAVITKMIRVLMLAPFLLGLSWWLARRPMAAPIAQPIGATTAPDLRTDMAPTRTRLTLPWFALGFVAVAGLRTLDQAQGLIAPGLLHALLWFDTWVLAAAMAALGLTTHAVAIRRAGRKPLMLAGGLFVWLLFGGALINAVTHRVMG